MIIFRSFKCLISLYRMPHLPWQSSLKSCWSQHLPRIVIELPPNSVAFNVYSINSSPPLAQPWVWRLLPAILYWSVCFQVDWDRIEKLPEDAIRDYETLPIPDRSKVKEMLNKLVVIKLNGGLGTSMGCVGPKSLISVRNDLTFLDLTVQQIEHLNKEYDCDVPLVLMNSFNTDDDSQKILRKYKGFRVKIYTFMQSKWGHEFWW